MSRVEQTKETNSVDSLADIYQKSADSRWKYNALDEIVSSRLEGYLNNPDVLKATLIRIGQQLNPLNNTEVAINNAKYACNLLARIFKEGFKDNNIPQVKLKNTFNQVMDQDKFLALQNAKDTYGTIESYAASLAASAKSSATNVDSLRLMSTPARQNAETQTEDQTVDQKTTLSLSS